MSAALSKIENLQEKAEAVHVAALNLSRTLGVFHGINNAVERGALAAAEIRAIDIIQFDLLNLLLIRVCALCFSNQSERPDDASIDRLVSALRDQALCGKLADDDARWRANIGPRAERCATVQKSIETLQSNWQLIMSQPEVWKRLNHFRNKRLAHTTVAEKPPQEAQLMELWNMARNALNSARQVRLIFFREDFDYLQWCADAESAGRSLIEAIEPETSL